MAHIAKGSNRCRNCKSVQGSWERRKWKKRRGGGKQINSLKNILGLTEQASVGQSQGFILSTSLCFEKDTSTAVHWFPQRPQTCVIHPIEFLCAVHVLALYCLSSYNFISLCIHFSHHGRTQLFHSCQHELYNQLGNWHFIHALAIHERN